MSLVRSPVRSSVSPLAISLLGGSGLSIGAVSLGATVDAELQELIEAGGTVSQIEVQDLTSMRAATDGSGSAVSVGDSVGYIVDSSQLGGETVAAYAAANGISDITTIPGNHWSAPSDTARPILLDTFSDPNDSALTDNGQRGEELAGGDYTPSSTADGQLIQSGVATVEAGVEYEITYSSTNNTAGGFFQLRMRDSAGLAVLSTGIALESLGTSFEETEKFRPTASGALDARWFFSSATGSATVTISVRKVLSAFDERGPELVENGDFSAGTAGWTNLDAESFTVTDGVARVEHTTNYGNVYQAITTEIGKTYALTYSVGATDGNTYCFVQVLTSPGSGNLLNSAIGANANTTRTVYFTATQTTHYIDLGNAQNTGSDWATWNSVSVKEIPYLNKLIQVNKAISATGDDDSTFDTDTGNWNKGTGWTISGGTANHTGNAGSFQYGGLEQNKWYLLKVYVPTITGGSLFIRVGDPNINDLIVNTTGWHEVYTRADGTGLNFFASTGVDVSIDNVIVQEVPASIARKYFLRFDGVDDQLTLTDTFGSDMTVVMGMKTSDTVGMLINTDNINRYIGVYDGGSSSVLSFSVGAPSFRLDGAAISPATRADFRALIADGNQHVFTASGADLSAAVNLVLGFRQASDAFNIAMDVTYLAIFPSDADTLALNEQLAAEVAGVTLP